MCLTLQTLSAFVVKCGDCLNIPEIFFKTSASVVFSMLATLLSAPLFFEFSCGQVPHCSPQLRCLYYSRKCEVIAVCINAFPDILAVALYYVISSDINCLNEPAVVYCNSPFNMKGHGLLLLCGLCCIPPVDGEGDEDSRHFASFPTVSYCSDVSLVLGL